MLTFKITLCAFLALCATIDVSSGKFRVIREWNFVNFTWPNAETYKKAFEDQSYVPQNNTIAGLKQFEGYFYVTLPRMKEGVPATLARIPWDPSNDTAPLLSPFPSWELNKIDDCDALQNVQNVEIDPAKGWIWIIDGGRTRTLTDMPVVKCQPKLLVYDIKNMAEVLRHAFPENVAHLNGSFLYDIVLDNTDGGYAYITDNGGADPGIIVFTLKDQKSWKIRHAQSMRAEPTAAKFVVNDIPIAATLNIASIALGPKTATTVESSKDRQVFYSPISSVHLYSINSSVLRNEEFAKDDGEFQGDVRDYGLKKSQSVGMVMDNQGVLYFSLLPDNSIAMWDYRTPFRTGQKIIAKDERYLEWINSFCIDEAGNLVSLVNRLNRFITEKLNLSEANFRLISSNIGEKSYLYDDLFKTSNSTQTSTTTETQNHDTNEVPTAEPEPSSSKPPKPEASSTSRSASVTDKAPSSSASERIALGLLSLLTAGMIFLV